MALLINEPMGGVLKKTREPNRTNSQPCWRTPFSLDNSKAQRSYETKEKNPFCFSTPGIQKNSAPTSNTSLYGRNGLFPTTTQRRETPFWMRFSSFSFSIKRLFALPNMFRLVRLFGPELPET